jgi:hypothetical protein
VPVNPLAPDAVTSLNPADSAELLRAHMARCAEAAGLALGAGRLTGTDIIVGDSRAGGLSVAGRPAALISSDQGDRGDRGAPAADTADAGSPGRADGAGGTALAGSGSAVR